MNRHIAGMCHIAFWAFLFFSPLTYWRGTGITLPHYLMICMQPAMTLFVFYLNYIYLAPKFFVPGKHRYDLLINLVLVFFLGITLHHWMNITNEIFIPGFKGAYNPLNTISYVLRDSINFAIFAAGATALALARRWVTADQKWKESEAARAKAELMNLRSQISPHFLLNTLNNIYALISFDAPKAKETIQELSKMLRHILYDYQQPLIPLRDEISFLENYVKLMRIRMSQDVEVSFKTPSEQYNGSIAPMILISLVENAFKHGISPREHSYIHITIKTNGPEIICDISNSHHPKTSSDKSGHGIGLIQVQSRLDLLYPNRYTWLRGISDDGKSYRSCLCINTKEDTNEETDED